MLLLLWSFVVTLIKKTIKQAKQKQRGISMYFWPQLFKRWMAIALPGEKLFKIFKGPWRSAQASFEDLIKIQKRWINAIHWINHYPVHCIVIYPVDSVIHLLNNWRQYGTTKALSTFISVLFELTDIFFFPVCPTVHTYVFGENCHRKCIFSKTFSRVEIFEKSRLLVYVWTDENGGFPIRWCHTSCSCSMTHAP